MKKVCAVFLSVAMVLSLWACGEREGVEEERISRVLTQLFTCPYEGLAEAIGKGGAVKGGSGEINSAVEECYHALFQQEGFSPDYWERFPLFASQTMMFPTVCALNEVVLSPKRVTVEIENEESRTYRFSVELEAGEKKTVLTVKGRAQTDENGKLSFLDPDLTELMQEIGF